MVVVLVIVIIIIIFHVANSFYFLFQEIASTSGLSQAMESLAIVSSDDSPYVTEATDSSSSANDSSSKSTIDKQALRRLRYQPPFRTVCARIGLALVLFIKTPKKHIFFESLIIPDYGFLLRKTINLNVFRKWEALCRSACLYKSCSTPSGNKQKKTINTAFASQHVRLKYRVSDF